MASRVVQLDSDDLARLDKLGVAYKDVTARERRLKLTINELKCQLAGDSRRYFVTERAKFVQLCRVAEAARGVLAGGELALLEKELEALGDLPKIDEEAA
ncbi:MAG: hypothetical protein LC624_00255 [Halobacteriales archaeon]|nr:hypothetical protein [Halobacteriales archaeon]